MAYTPALGTVIEGSGVPSDALFITAPSDGQQYLDQLTGITYTRVRGVWQTMDGRITTSNPPGGAATSVANGAQTTGAAVTGDDSAGQVTFTTTATPAAGVQATVTYGTPLPSAPRSVELTGANALSGAAGASVGSVTATGFTIVTNAAPTASSAYAFDYEVIN